MQGGYHAWCNESDCSWEERDLESSDAAVEALAQHCLEKHPEVALQYPVVQVYAQRVAAKSAPTNGAMTRNG